MESLIEKLEVRKKANCLRKLQYHPDFTDFFSNDYLGLARSMEVEALIYEEYKSIKGVVNINGSSGSRLLSGNNAYIEATEQKLASFFSAERTLIFNSGYNANVALLSSVPQKGDTIIYDELVHASLKDGARLSFAKRLSFQHNHLPDLEKKLRHAQGNVFVVVESLYSMDGDFCPLQDLIHLCNNYNAKIIIDEAHSTGIYGNKGEGMVCQLNLQDQVFARVYTFGKAIGQHGACIAGSNELIEYLVNFARTFIYTTALPLHSIAAIYTSIQYINDHPQLSRQLQNNISLFGNLTRQYLNGIGGIKFNPDAPIQIIPASGNNVAIELGNWVAQNGINAKAILSPTVKEGQERLRICLHAFNSRNEIENLVYSIHKFFHLKLNSL